MTQLLNLTNEVTEFADDDWIYVYDTSVPANPDGKMRGIRLRPTGAKITNLFRYDGSINIPALAAGVEADCTIAITGILLGDHLTFNLAAALPANLNVSHAWVSANDTVTVRMRNLHASTGYAGGSLACTALVSRSITP